MKLVTVYRVDYVRKTRVPIGWVAERRRKDRGNNLLGLIRLARSTYGTGDEDSIYITVDGGEARRPWATRHLSGAATTGTGVAAAGRSNTSIRD